MRIPSTTALCLAIACAGPACKKKLPAPPTPPLDAPAPTLGAPEPLPGGSPDGAVGDAAKATFVAAADDGAWVLLCQPYQTPFERLHVVVGDGPGLLAQRVVAAADRDLVVLAGDAMLHVDVPARTVRRLGPIGAAAIDGESRRVVHADGTKVVVLDPGQAPRTVETGDSIAHLALRGKRWLSVEHGDPPKLDPYSSCGWVDHAYEIDDATIDLDPSGLEANDRIGPELGITGAGEVTLDGVTVAGADCVATVIAALAQPPRALVGCSDGMHVVGPGLDRAVHGSIGGKAEQATISEHLTLGERLVCVTGACIDLTSGRDFGTYETPSVWADDRFIVRKGGGGLLVDDLDQDRQREVVLPRLTQAVTVDTATGRRVAGPAPTPPAFVDAAGRFLLYGRHVVDVDAAALVATLPADGLAIDRSGRVLVAPAPERGPLRWRKP